MTVLFVAFSDDNVQVISTQDYGYAAELGFVAERRLTVAVGFNPRNGTNKCRRVATIDSASTVADATRLS